MTMDEKTKAISVIADLIKRLDDANPDIGWGMSRRTAVDQALARMGWSHMDVAYDQLVNRR